MKKNIISNHILTKDRVKLIQKAILTGIGVTASKDTIKKAAVGIYNDVQKITHRLLKELEQRGEIKTKEAKKIIKELQKKSDAEKTKIYKKLQKEGRTLLKSAREIILTPLSILKDTISTLKHNKKAVKLDNKLINKRKKKIKRRK